MSEKHPTEVHDEEKRSLQLELSSIETLLQVINDQQERSVTPLSMPQHTIRDAQVLRERANIIRSLLKFD